MFPTRLLKIPLTLPHIFFKPFTKPCTIIEPKDWKRVEGECIPNSDLMPLMNALNISLTTDIQFIFAKASIKPLTSCMTSLGN